MSEAFEKFVRRLEELDNPSDQGMSHYDPAVEECRQGIEAELIAERKACFQCAVSEAEWATGDYASACENIQQKIRERGL